MTKKINYFKTSDEVLIESNKSYKRELLNKKGENDLKDYAIEYILDYYNDNEEIESFVSDLLQHGCVSGMIGSLIYYTDTVAFYEKYQTEINELLYRLLESTGCSINELFRGFDNKDPLCIEQSNQNLVAWFGFEETVRILADELEIEY